MLGEPFGKGRLSMKWPWEGLSTVAVQVSRQTGEGVWVAIGSLTVEDDGGTHSDPGVDERIVTEVLISLYRNNVAFGTTDLDGVAYRWEEIIPQEKRRYLYQ
jgi:hypothetical protein